MSYIVRPLDPWIGPVTASRRESAFKAGWTDTLTLLEREIRMLGAWTFVLQVDVDERWIRVDGELYARAASRSPAVRVSFESRHGPLTYATDVFDQWQANVRAIALSLEALRRVDRYGVAGKGEQYRGWNAIGSRPAEMTPDQAAEFIALWGDLPGAVPRVTGADLLARPSLIRDYYRRAASRVHPDVTGDDGDTMARLNAARDLLNASTPGAAT